MTERGSKKIFELDGDLVSCRCVIDRIVRPRPDACGPVVRRIESHDWAVVDHDPNEAAVYVVEVCPELEFVRSIRNDGQDWTDDPSIDTVLWGGWWRHKVNFESFTSNMPGGCDGVDR